MPGFFSGNHDQSMLVTMPASPETTGEKNTRPTAESRPP